MLLEPRELRCAPRDVHVQVLDRLEDRELGSKQAIDPAVLFKSRDKNQDGFLTLKEYIGNPKNRNVPVLTKRFNNWDRNKDSRVTLKEMTRN